MKNIALGLAAIAVVSCADPEDDSRRIAWTADNSIVAYGTSLTAGLVEADSAYPALLGEMLTIEVVNRGIVGATSAEGLTGLDAIYQYGPVLVILEFGANDFLQTIPLETARTNIRTMIEEISGYGAEVALLNFAHPDMIECTLNNPAIKDYLDTLPPQAVQAFINFGLSYDAMIDSLALEYGLVFEDYLYEGIACDSTMLLWDFVHPNAAGNRQLADNVFTTLFETLEQSGMLKP